MLSIGQEQFICQERMPGGGSLIHLGAWRDRIPGGIADKMKPWDFDQSELRRGLKVELEHTSDRRLALEIAMDHLAEDPFYYRTLRTAHFDGVQLGGVREDIVSKLAIVMGSDPAAKAFDDFEALIERKAAEGAERKVKPLVITSIVVASVAGVLGVGAIALTLLRR